MNFSPMRLLRVRPLPESIYVELIDELFSITPSVLIFAVSLCIVGAAIYIQIGDEFVLGLVLAGLVVSCERLLMLRSYHRVARTAPLSRAEAAVWERRFARRSLATATIVSAMSVRCFMLADPAIHMLIVGVLFSYAAGMIMRVAYRPRLALFNILIIAIPAAIATLMHGGIAYICLGLSMIVFMFGSIDIIRYSYETIVSQLSLKNQFAGLAHQDALTGLSNRLGLSENLESVLAEARRNGHGLAVHSLDLDRFKAANDLFGHPAGDEILKEVGRRLTRLTRSSDMLVRLGGDEFMLIQTGVTSRSQTIALASRIINDIGSVYEVNGYKIEIGTSIGIAITTGEELSPDELLARADQALYQAKRSKSGFVIHTDAPHLVPAQSNGDDREDRSASARKTASLH